MLYVSFIISSVYKNINYVCQAMHDYNDVNYEIIYCLEKVKK